MEFLCCEDGVIERRLGRVRFLAVTLACPLGLHATLLGINFVLQPSLSSNLKLPSHPPMWLTVWHRAMWILYDVLRVG
jgi:hypothetical protein